MLLHSNFLCENHKHFVTKSRCLQLCVILVLIYVIISHLEVCDAVCLTWNLVSCRCWHIFLFNVNIFTSTSIVSSLFVLVFGPDFCHPPPSLLMRPSGCRCELNFCDISVRDISEMGVSNRFYEALAT